MAQVNSFPLFFGAIYPTEADVKTGVNYGDQTNPLTGTGDIGGGITPSPPDWSTLYGVAYDEDGQPEEDVTIKAKLVSAPAGKTESVFDYAIRETMTNSSGEWQFQNFPQGGTVQVNRGHTWETVQITQETVTPVDDFVGSDQQTGLVGGMW